MEINWFTVIAQVINFFILVWLLKRFLYQPILNAIDERESKIAAQLKDAEVKKAEAKEEQKDFQQKNLSFDQEKETLMAKAVSAATEERQKLFANARAEAEDLAEKLAVAAKEQQHNEQKAHQEKIQHAVFAIARKTLADLAAVGLEEQLTLAFIKRLKALKEAELKQLKAAFTGTTDPLLVRSAVALPEKQQQALKQAIDEVLSADTSLTFEVIPALIGGVELSTHEYKLAWSIAEYLRVFEETIPPLNNGQPTPPALKKQNA
jgi:F-type H+-transporting ATPase subunit b